MVGIGTLGRTILPKIWQSIHDSGFSQIEISGTYGSKNFQNFLCQPDSSMKFHYKPRLFFYRVCLVSRLQGYYSLSYSMLVLPVSLISNSIMQVYFGEISELFRQKSDKILPLYQETTKKLFMFGAPIILIGAVISPIFFPIIFGSAWKDAGMFSLPLSMLVISNFVVASTDRLDFYGFNDWQLAWNISRTILVLAGFYIAFLFTLSPVTTILLYSSIMTIMYVVCYILNIKAIKLVLQKKEVPITD